MRILITGAAGQLGTELQEILKNGQCREGKLPRRFSGAAVTAVGSSALNILDRERARAVMEEVRPDLVFNCAAYTAVDRAETDAEKCMAVNRDGAAILAELCAERGVLYVYPSTESVFGGEQTTPYTEEDDTRPKNVYGRSKLAGEQAVLQVCPTALIPRAGWLYGFYGKNFVKTIGSLAAKRDSLTVVSDQHGNPTNVDVFCLRIFQLLDAGAGGVFHCVDRDVTTRFEYAKTIVRSLDLPCEVRPCTTEEYPSPTPRSLYMGMDCGKMERFLHVQARGWREVLADYMEEAKRRGIFA